MRKPSVFSRKLPLEEESAVFILVNFADVVLTGLAIRYGAGEANPLANWIWGTFGLYGMAIYKFGLVTFVLLVCQVVYPTHPKTARGVLVAGSAAYGILVVAVTIGLFIRVLRSF